MESKPFSCQICFEEYSKERKPMIVCKEGHSVCEHCLKKIDSCPFCRSSFENFESILNRDLLQSVEEMKEKKKLSNVPIIPLSELKVAKESFALGGSADIYKAKWGNNLVALKKMRIQTNQKLRNQFENELQLAVKLNHPNIIKIYGMVEYKKSFGILMEFGEQGNLEQKIPKLSLSKKIDYSLKIIDGIKYLHLNSIIHRDLKPQNILISNDQPKICDFGLSKIHEHTMKNTTAFVSFGYSAPELFQQGSIYDSSCDIFSLSMILFQMFSKKKPFQDENAFDIPQKIKQGERPEFPNHFPKELIEVIKKGWNQNPKERCSLNEFIQCLDQLKRKRRRVNGITKKEEIEKTEEIQIKEEIEKTEEIQIIPQFQIFVKDLHGKSFSFFVDYEETVEDFMNEVYQNLGIPKEQQRLILKGKQMRIGKKFKDYPIEHGNTIYLVLRTPGGLFKN
ncbi:palmitoyltransferase [Anaeramoeba ignava]|uniref:Palmitoyltransferase n=1 Tax=Anaeramoeba ignava TaxID=1746090 RepID=A0A9Q0LU39_ANAIG|nr:palmitoyltransferase [Anaeramoeba ignava]